MKRRLHWLLVFAAAATICCLSVYGSENEPIVPHSGDDHVVTVPFPIPRLQQLEAQTNQVLRSNSYWPTR